MEDAKKINFLFKENKSSRYYSTYKSHTNAVTSVCNIFQAFRDNKKVVIKSFSCFLFLNCG